LRVCTLNNNELSGSIPAELGQLGAPTGLFLDSNQLSGSIPAELGELGALAELNLQGNQLAVRQGGLPEPHGRAPRVGCELIL
jgi:hypothetical protein